MNYKFNYTEYLRRHMKYLRLSLAVQPAENFILFTLLVMRQTLVNWISEGV